MIRNTTREDHIFHNFEDPDGSFVDRTVVVENSFIKIKTRGEGTGRFPKTNEWAGPLIFTGTDALISAAVVGNPLCDLP